MKATILALALVLAAPGCGTIIGSKLSGPSPYIGVRTDYIAVSEGAEWQFIPDFPVSFVVDTVLFPFDLVWWLASR